MSSVLNDTLDVTRSTPRTFSFSKPFWDATRDRKILLQYCPVAKQFQFYPRPTSLFTGRT